MTRRLRRTRDSGLKIQPAEIDECRIKNGGSNEPPFDILSHRDATRLEADQTFLLRRRSSSRPPRPTENRAKDAGSGVSI